MAFSQELSRYAALGLRYDVYNPISTRLSALAKPARATMPAIRRWPWLARCVTPASPA